MKTPRNTNRWSETMTLEAMGLIAKSNVPTQMSIHQEPTLSLSEESRAILRKIADVLNNKYKTTLTEYSISNRYKEFYMSDEQRAARDERKRKAKLKKKEKNTPNVTSSVEASLPNESPSSATNIDVIQVVVKCSRLINDGALTKQELITLLNMI
jgi:hypothetical protein